uniref:Uncharacterized protein n=1 Tax=Aegilops tauschii subsp. strangulata TaxID=200361 RepID=A0A453RIR5_AEGTS
RWWLRRRIALWLPPDLSFSPISFRFEADAEEAKSRRGGEAGRQAAPPPGLAPRAREGEGEGEEQEEEVARHGDEISEQEGVAHGEPTQRGEGVGGG